MEVMNDVVDLLRQAGINPMKLDLIIKKPVTIMGRIRSKKFGIGKTTASYGMSADDEIQTGSVYFLAATLISCEIIGNELLAHVEHVHVSDELGQGKLENKEILTFSFDPTDKKWKTHILNRSVVASMHFSGDEFDGFEEIAVPAEPVDD